MTVNITESKQMTNVSSATKDQAAVIKLLWHLDTWRITWVQNDDEYMEVTPESIRLRKQIASTRQSAKKQTKRKNQIFRLNKNKKRSDKMVLFNCRCFDPPFLPLRLKKHWRNSECSNSGRVWSLWSSCFAWRFSKFFQCLQNFLLAPSLLLWVPSLIDVRGCQPSSKQSD